MLGEMTGPDLSAMLDNLGAELLAGRPPPLASSLQGISLLSAEIGNLQQSARDSASPSCHGRYGGGR